LYQFFYKMIAMLLSLIFSLASGGALCQEPIYYGELRPRKTPMRCLGTDDNKLILSECKGWTDQIHMYCGDGTFRNYRSKFCLQANEYNRLQYYACEVLPEIPAKQKWSVSIKGDWVDDFGISQKILSFKSLKDDTCMWLSSDSHTPGTEMQTHTCSPDNLLMYFFFRSKGKLIQSGNLRNQKDNTKCISLEDGQIDGNVGTHTCSIEKRQRWKQYESGEIVNQETRCCLGPEKFDAAEGRNLAAGACDYQPDLRWDTPEAYADGQFLGFRNLLSDLCLDVEGHDGFGNMVIYTCELRADQRFEWVSENWTPPDAEWSLMKCNENGKITLQVSNSVSYENSVTEEIAVSVEATIEAGLLFEKVSTSVSVSTAVATTWTNTYTETVTTTVSCDYYITGEEFKGGCMWQLQMKTKDVKNKELEWLSSSIIRCTKGLEKPICPPFTTCQDDECQKCVDMTTHDEL